MDVEAHHECSIDTVRNFSHCIKEALDGKPNIYSSGLRCVFGTGRGQASISVTFTDRDRFLKSLRMPYSAEHLLNHVRKHFPNKKVAFVYEAGPTGYGLYDGIVAQGYPCLIAAPSMIPKAPGQRVKTNRLDSKALSESLRGGQLKSIHVPSPFYRELRHLTQLRDVLVSELAGMKQRIKSLLLFEGIEFPPLPPAVSGRV